MTPVLQVKKLSVTHGERSVLRDINFDVTAGDFVTLVGANGSGKTTLLNALLGSVKGTGDITWFDRPLKSWKPRDLAKKIAYLPQIPTYEVGDRVIDVVRLGRLPHQGILAIESAADDTAVSKVMSTLGLTELTDRAMETLSGGQRQFVYLARALAQEPQVLLLDEATTFLDLRHQVELHQLLRRAVAENNITIVMASHDLNLAALHATRAIVLKDGQILAQGPIDQTMTPAILSNAFDVNIIQATIGTRPIFSVADDDSL